ncbi:SpaH/EbpB family LPXTG-anchored major pilin [Corynebacterium sp. p3-SID1194]|uniref:SpaH/EbpB family LPXTG-anchored major pilin n=1 Tax=Corynebacterium sp. p3-SID1194 TaxID=2916105 RepID=UPI0021A37D1E|nr:SpaH/EbpB family LPXTG-anchored major pilin [Corynebacterium sp. p3-SID1194]MCT1451284.1 SpaH/EbpB family LPXTG-anchored major pilin [Corynebacterium sp. p3-SID1194]
MKKSALVRSTGAAAVLGLALSVGSIGVAQAPLAVAQEASTNNNATIDPDADVTLTIDKRLNPTSIGGHGTGEADQNVTGNPLQGATFTGTLLNVDNVKPEDLGKLTASNYKELGATATQTTVTGKTGDNGQLKLGKGNGLVQGIWLFTETIEGEVTDTVTGKTYKASEIAPSTPFIVSLPYTNAKGDGWNYDVTVQPKNTTSGITKEVVDADQNVGDDIQYLVKGSIPAIPEGETLKSFRITDQLDTENLENIRAQVALSDGTAIAEGTDYNVTIDQAAGTVEVKFTEAGLTKLAGVGAGKTVDLTIDAKVKEITGTDGIAVNEAKQFIHYPGQEKETETTSNEVKTYWGLVKVVKTEKGSETALKGAEFELYRCEGTETKKDQLDAENKITIGEKSTWTTGDDGTVIIDGIHVTDIEDDSKEIDKSYCLVETKAPSGFVATNEVHSFKLASDDKKLNTETPVQYDAKIENQRSEMPKLPLTGGMGIGLLVALGALIAGLAAWTARRANAEA